MRKLITAGLFFLIAISAFFLISLGSSAHIDNSKDAIRPSPLFEYSLTSTIEELEDPQKLMAAYKSRNDQCERICPQHGKRLESAARPVTNLPNTDSKEHKDPNNTVP
ncbi:MAG: hypothetical protein JRE65_08305, partial [Deltaproteobacteria bacterium]|nr:hypothetical protein [Deltaproteobacteria bacterium]